MNPLLDVSLVNQSIQTSESLNESVQKLSQLVTDMGQYILSFQFCGQCGYGFQNKIQPYQGRHPLCKNCRPYYGKPTSKKNNSLLSVYWVRCINQYTTFKNQTPCEFIQDFIIPVDHLNDEMVRSLQCLHHSVIQRTLAHVVEPIEQKKEDLHGKLIVKKSLPIPREVLSYEHEGGKLFIEKFPRHVYFNTFQPQIHNLVEYIEYYKKC